MIGPPKVPPKSSHLRGAFSCPACFRKKSVELNLSRRRVVVGAAVELVGAAAGHQVDLRAAGLAELGAVVVALDLELLDRVHRGVDQDRAVGAHVVVVGAVHRPEVGGGRAAAHRDVGAAGQALVAAVQAVRARTRPAAGTSSCMKLRPFSGSSRASWPVTRPETSAPTSLDRHRRHLDVHDLGHVARLELHVHRAGVGDVQRRSGSGPRT